MHTTINATHAVTTNAKLNTPARPLVKLTGIGLAAALLLFIAAALAAQLWNGLEAGQPAPAFQGYDLQGQQIQLADYAGKPVMLTFWSPDCSACREELPALQAIATDPQADVTLVTVVSKLPAAEVRQFVTAAGLTFPVIVDEAGTIAAAYQIVGVPISYFINPAGTIDHSVLGAGREGALQQNLFTWLNTCNLDEVCQ